jgi:hypothetical protein
MTNGNEGFFLNIGIFINLDEIAEEFFVKRL